MLAATSKQMCQLMRAHVTVLITSQKNVLNRLQTTSWPQVNTLVFKGQPWEICLNANHQWRILACITLHTTTLLNRVVLVIEPLADLVVDNDLCKVKALDHLLQSNWANVDSFSIKIVKSDTLGAKIVEKLSSAGCVDPAQIALGGNQFGIKTMSALVNSKWRNLTKLSLAMDQFDSQVMQQLVKGEWPCLETLALTSKRHLGANGTTWLKTPNWTSLQQLELTSTPINAAMMQLIVRLPLPLLTTMRLMSCRIGTLAAEELRNGNWPCLTDLDMSQNLMAANAMASLALAAIPNLEVLRLPHTRMNAAGMQQLVQAAWPKLLELNVSHNELDCEAVGYLVTCQWSSLKRLNLASNEIDRSGIQVLVKGNWPKLQKLMLDPFSLIHQNSAAILEFTRADLLKPGRCFTDVVCRNKSPRKLWPNLTKIMVASGLEDTGMDDLDWDLQGYYR